MNAEVILDVLTIHHGIIYGGFKLQIWGKHNGHIGLLFPGESYAVIEGFDNPPISSTTWYKRSTQCCHYHLIRQAAAAI